MLWLHWSELNFSHIVFLFWLVILSVLSNYPCCSYCFALHSAAWHCRNSGPAHWLQVALWKVREQPRDWRAHKHINNTRYNMRQGGKIYCHFALSWCWVQCCMWSVEWIHRDNGRVLQPSIVQCIISKPSLHLSHFQCLQKRGHNFQKRQGSMKWLGNSKVSSNIACLQMTGSFADDWPCGIFSTTYRVGDAIFWSEEVSWSWYRTEQRSQYLQLTGPSPGSGLILS